MKSTVTTEPDFYWDCWANWSSDDPRTAARNEWFLNNIWKDGDNPYVFRIDFYEDEKSVTCHRYTQNAEGKRYLIGSPGDEDRTAAKDSPVTMAISKLPPAEIR